MRTAVGVAVLAGAAYVLWRRPATRRFVATVRESATEREAQLRAAVETAVREDATTRAPRHAADARIPDLDVDAGWGEGEGRSLTPDEARDLLLDPAGRGRRAADAGPADRAR